MNTKHATDVAKIRRAPSTHAKAKLSVEEILSAARARGTSAKPALAGTDVETRIDAARQRFAKR